MNPILRIRRQAGVGIVTAIFLLVVLAGLGTAMVGIYTSQQSSANLDLLGAEAYQAARAGVEWGIFQQRQRNGACAAKTRIDMPAGTSLSAFTVFVTCEVKGEGALTRFFIKANACNMPDLVQEVCPASNKPESVLRTMEVEL
jgi:MSHA biogenesis protein MshP